MTLKYIMKNSSLDYIPDIAVDASNFTVDKSNVQTPMEFLVFVLICTILVILIIATIIGNAFVMVAIVRDKNLNNLSNYLVFSLALADLLVALLVMPLGAVYEVSEEWSMGPELCDLWTSCDVLCCTASILHLLAIAMDRYWAVTNLDYARNRCKKRIYFAITLVWTVSFTVSIAPIFGWKDPDFNTRIEVDKECLVSQDVGYQVFATFSSFYVPLILILILYSRIFREARRRIRRRPGAASQAMLLIQKPPPLLEPKKSSSSTSGEAPSCVADTTLSSETVTSVVEVPQKQLLTVTNSNGTTTTTTSTETKHATNSPKTTFSTTSAAVVRLLHFAKREKKQDNFAKREKKAAKTLAIITGVFVICWLPFFVIALLSPLCDSCKPNETVFSIFLWLGYANSMLNPIIYTIFSPDFRSAFRKLLCGAPSSLRPNT